MYLRFLLLRYKFAVNKDWALIRICFLRSVNGSLSRTLATTDERNAPTFTSWGWNVKPTARYVTATTTATAPGFTEFRNAPGDATIRHGGCLQPPHVQSKYDGQPTWNADGFIVEPNGEWWPCGIT